MKIAKNNLLFFALFAGGIVLPTAILSVLSFRNIQDEFYLAQKNFNENRAAFLKEIEENIDKEQDRIYVETKNASLFLYEQPQSLLEFGNATVFKEVAGVEAIFLFNDGKLVFPDVSTKVFENHAPFSSKIPSIEEKQLFQLEESGEKWLKIQSANIRELKATLDPRSRLENILGLIRLAYKEKRYDEAIALLNILERVPHLEGYLHADLTPSIKLLHFEILVEQKKHKEAKEYCINYFKQFLKSKHLEEIASAKFFFEEAFSRITSFEDLSKDERDNFWNLHQNFNHHLKYMDIFSKNKEVILELLENDYPSNKGIYHQNQEGGNFFKMSYPLLSGNQIAIVKNDKDAFQKRLLLRVEQVAQAWKNIPYSLTDSQNEVILGNIPDSSAVYTQRQISDAFNWEFTLYEKDVKEIRKETKQRMFLMYGLLSFSLITVILGSFFMLRFITQERKLLAMKSNFLSSISHELKTPLTSIKMFAEMMARGRVKAIEKVAEYSNLIGKEASRLEDLIGAILSYTRMEHGTQSFKWERLDFSICVQKVFNAVEDIGVEKGLIFSTQIEPSAMVMGDYTALYSLVQNLIENAIKYTNEGEITIKVFTENNTVVFSVADTGIGIPSAEQKNIFNDFYRVGDELTRNTKGSGLGLAIVKRVAETHKATISLVSKLGKGSTFTVKFKRVE